MTKDRVDQVFEKVKKHGITTVFAVAFAAQIVWANYENQKELEAIRVEIQGLRLELVRAGSQ